MDNANFIIVQIFLLMLIANAILKEVNANNVLKDFSWTIVHLNVLLYQLDA
jgi:hypothetical protein